MPAASIRTPLYGLICPRTTFAVNLIPPLTERERAVVISTTPDFVRWQVMSAGAVVISNESDSPLVWTMVFLPIGDVLPPFDSWKPLIADIWAKIREARAVAARAAAAATSAKEEP